MKFSFEVCCLTLCCLLLAGVTAFAQNKKGKQESCDGVLDVVPTKSVTFTRKRRPEKTVIVTPSASAPAAQPTTRKKSR